MMKLTTLILIALGITLGWQARGNIHSDVSSGGLLEASPEPTPAQQLANQQGNAQWHREQIVAAARAAAGTAAAYARQAAGYHTASSKKAAQCASLAAADADLAARYAAAAGVTPSTDFQVPQGVPDSLEAAAADAARQAVNAKQAAEQAPGDSIINNIVAERDAGVAAAKVKYQTEMDDLEIRIKTLKQKAERLDRQMTESRTHNSRLRARQMFLPTDPWRMLKGKFCSAKDKYWYLFQGKILSVQPNGILMHGDFGLPQEPGFGERDFFVEHFPVQTYPLADGEAITPALRFVAYLDPQKNTCQVTNPSVRSPLRTVRRLDYGEIVVTPPPDLLHQWQTPAAVPEIDPELFKQLNAAQTEQADLETRLAKINSQFDQDKAPIVAQYQAKIDEVPIVLARQAREKAETQKQAALDGIVKHQQELADHGDEFGLLRMGERYRDGDGVPKDLAKAKDYLQKAAAAGSPTATTELGAFPTQ